MSLRSRGHNHFISILVLILICHAFPQEHTLVANVELILTTKERKPWTRPPIQMSFQVGSLYRAILAIR